MDYGTKLAVNYEKELNKEYGIVDLKGYKKGKIGIRWRTKEEVLSGNGYRICGEAKCEKHKELNTFLAPFVYLEHGEYKHCDIKLRLCDECGLKLNYKTDKKQRKKERKRKRKRDRSRHKKHRKKHKKT